MKPYSPKIASSSTILRRSSRLASKEIMKDNSSEFKSFAHSVKTNKSPETSIPAPNHSVNRDESKEEEVKFASKSDDCYSLTHPNRNSNLLPSDERNKKDKLQLPSPNDPIWKDIDHELHTALPVIFKKSVLNNNTSQDLIEKFDNWLYDFFFDKFGTVPAVEAKPIYVKTPHKGLQRLREDKKRVRKTMRFLKKAG